MYLTTLLVPFLVVLLLFLVLPTRTTSFPLLLHSVTTMSSSSSPNNNESNRRSRRNYKRMKKQHVVATTSSTPGTTSTTRLDVASSSPPTSTSTNNVSCKFCNDVFPSRNALFKHLRTNVECFTKASEASGRVGGDAASRSTKSNIELPKRTMIIRFGYYHYHGIVDANNESNEFDVANLVKTSFFEVLGKKQPVDVDTTSGEGSTLSSNDNTISQASVAKHRHPCLGQEVNDGGGYSLPALSDFVSINYKGEDIAPAEMKLLQIAMQQHLDQQLSNTTTKIQLIDMKEVPISLKFHAEQSCTQRMYHYLLPLDWLEGGDDEMVGELSYALYNLQRNKKQHIERGTVTVPDLIIKLKNVLKLFESVDVVNNPDKKDKNSNMLASPGRFGSLWKKQRICWHNFADPSLGGNMKSPNCDAVWRTIDKIQVTNVICHHTSDDNDDEKKRYMAVIEFRGDGFVKQQVRRIIGSIVAIMNGWLPSSSLSELEGAIDVSSDDSDADFTTVATRSDICIETPLAPSGRLYFANARYHFTELVTKGNDKNGASTFFSPSAAEDGDWQNQLHTNMLQITETTHNRQVETACLEELRDTVAPRIRSQLQDIKVQDEIRLVQRQKQQTSSTIVVTGQNVDAIELAPPPSPYEVAVLLLRDIVKQKKWPTTSKARSRVIRAIQNDGDTTSNTATNNGPSPNTYEGEKFQAGSFSVVNTDITNEKPTLANKLFPDLVKAIFELEAKLASQQQQQNDSPKVAEGTHRLDGPRPPSTHCAVNRNAEFVPHVDSGKGQGQSVSMIVGLGDYVGGATYVEGKPYDIRYQPLEFDGWKQRHWTEPFQGERYSLVWFSPAGVDITASEDGQRSEDVTADELIALHQMKLPNFPPIKYRRNSTDALVIKEILDPEKGCVYTLDHHSWNNKKIEQDFTAEGHHCVLDIGAHIGVFSRYALSVGCKKIIAYEPEPSNAEILSHNLRPVEETDKNGYAIDIHQAAVAHGSAGSRRLVHARNRNDGTVNTWRHSLEEYSQYVDKDTKLPSPDQLGTLTRTDVSTTPFFGGALVRDVTFVKLDCEGAEIDILLSKEASNAESWLNVTHLVVEWSFTKEKRVAVFQEAISNLKQAGFDVYYDGQNAWWEQNEIWPFHNDLVVYAIRT